MPPRRRLNKDGTDPFGTQPMELDIPQARNTGSETSRKPKYVQPAGRAQCPTCSTTNLTPFYRQGEHFVWKVHTKIAYGRGRFPCMSGGATLCSAPPTTPKFGGETPVCLCQRKE